jgi:predicted Zn finger-like uncharacterized protein
MQAECSACGARYTIADERIPAQGARVRCRKCQAVFQVEKPAPQPPTPPELPLVPPTPFSATPAEAFAPSADSAPLFGTPSAPPPTNVPAMDVERFAPAFKSGSTMEAEHRAPAMAPQPAAPSPQASAAQPGPEPPQQSPQSGPGSAFTAPSFSASAGIPPGLPEAERVKHERARRLARVLASDIAIYNKEKRDRGVKEGNLVAVLGYEIKKSWDVYKERVTPEMANSTPYFRDALNEMLAEGKKVF